MAAIKGHHVEVRTFELAQRLLSNPIDRDGGCLIPVDVVGFGNSLWWALVPINHPDLKPKTYKRSVPE